MTWYDGSPAPDPRRDDAAPVGGGRARLRAAARAASDADPVPHDGTVAAAVDGRRPGAASAADGGSDHAPGEAGAGSRGASGVSASGDDALPPDGTDGDRERFGADRGLGRFGSDGDGERFGADGGLGRFGSDGDGERFGADGGLGRFGSDGDRERFGADDDLDRFGGAGEGEASAADRPRLVDLVRWRLVPRTAVIALGALLLVGGAVAVRSAAQPTGEPVAVEEPAITAAATTDGAAPDGAEQPATAAAEEPTVWVHVVGRVAAPGVVALPAGSRVGDAVGAAGGPLPDADLAALNLAAVVQDGAQVRVPAPGEEPVVADAADGTAGSSGGGAAGPAGGGVDVNTAPSTELQTLPGIGPVLAERIVAWREANGPFGSVDALLDVSGIGPAVLGQIRDLVRV